MNDRIKDLWEEATVSTWPRPGKFTAGEYDHHLIKFAESIIRECMEIGDKALQDGKWPGDVLSEHFGIE